MPSFERTTTRDSLTPTGVNDSKDEELGKFYEMCLLYTVCRMPPECLICIYTLLDMSWQYHPITSYI